MKTDWRLNADENLEAVSADETRTHFPVGYQYVTIVEAGGDETEALLAWAGGLD